MLDGQIRGGDGDGLIDGDDDARAHGLGHFVGFGRCALLEGNFANFRKDDDRDDEIGQFEENGAEVNGVGTIFEAFEPSTGIKNIGLHGPHDEKFGESVKINYSFKYSIGNLSLITQLFRVIWVRRLQLAGRGLKHLGVCIRKRSVMSVTGFFQNSRSASRSN